MDTQPVSIPVVQLTQITTTQSATVIAKVQQPSSPSSASAHPTSYVVVDDQQPGTSRQLIFNPPSVAATLMDYSVSLELFPVYYSTSRSTHHKHFHPLNFNQHCHQCHFPLIIKGQDLPASRVRPNQQISLYKSHQPALLRATRIFQKQLFRCCCQKTKRHTVQHLHFPQINKKIV